MALVVRASWCCVWATVLAASGYGSAALAQTFTGPSSGQGCTAQGSVETPSQACLATLVTTFTVNGAYRFNALELAAAQADDAAYTSLLTTCAAPGSGACTGATLNLFNRLRELENNADQLLGFGQTAYSLNLSAQGVGNALRWTADEEFAVQSSVTSRFANNQLGAVTSRMTALQFAQTIRLAREDALGIDLGPDSELADDSGVRLGGGASADSDLVQYGRWNVFANGAYGEGSKSPTTFDDAFAFSGTQFSVGADVRLSRRLVLGVLVDYLHTLADFNPSESVASGGLHSDGWGATGYAQLEWDAAYLNFSLGGQRVSLDTSRLVAYPSNNPEIPSVNTTFLSDTNATSYMATGAGGYIFHIKGFSAEPYLNAQFTRTHISSFSETASGADLGFAAEVAGQSVTSILGVAGLKFEYVFLPSFGVVVPYVSGELRHEFRNPSQDVSSQFAAAPAGGDYFELPTDAVRSNYYQVGGGLSAVLPHGAQLYAQYVKVLKLQYYTDYVVSCGFRYEF